MLSPSDLLKLFCGGVRGIFQVIRATGLVPDVARTRPIRGTEQHKPKHPDTTPVERQASETHWRPPQQLRSTRGKQAKRIGAPHSSYGQPKRHIFCLPYPKSKSKRGFRPLAKSASFKAGP